MALNSPNEDWDAVMPAPLLAEPTQAVEAVSMDGVWHTLDTSRLVPDIAIFIIEGRILITASGKRFSTTPRPLTNSILVGCAEMCLDPNDCMWVTATSGPRVQCKRVLMPKRSTLSDMQGTWINYDERDGIKRTLMIQGIIWHWTFKRSERQGILKFKNGTALIQNTPIELSLRGQLLVHDSSANIRCFERSAYSRSLPAIQEH